MISFKNDYNVLAASKIIDALVKYKEEENIGYGEDYHTKNVSNLIKELTKTDVDSYLLVGGTQTNLVGLSHILKESYNAVISVRGGHITVHETGAIEGTNHKVIEMKAENGKANVSNLIEVYNQYKDYHMVKPHALYISNATEIGTIYYKDELKALYNECKKLGLYLFLDGARLSQALSASDNDLTLEDIAKNTDMFYLGGTKNGCPTGELLVVCNDNLKEDFKYAIKNRGALLAKGFFQGICFEEYLKDNYFLELAAKANLMADTLREELKDYLVYPNTTNQVFLKVKPLDIKELEKEFIFEIWEEHEDFSIIRIVTTYATKYENVKKFIKMFKNIKNNM